MIRKTSITKLVLNELQAYAMRIDEAFIKNQSEASSEQPYKVFYTEFKTKLEEFKNANLKTSSKISAKDLEKLDNKRDNAFLGLKHLTIAYTYAEGENYTSLSERMKRTIETHGWSMNNLSYKAQTTKMTNLIADIEKLFSTEELKTFYADGWVAVLKQRHEEFENYLAEYMRKKERDTPAPSTLKEPLISNLNELLNSLPLLEKMNQGTNIKDLIDNVNNITERTDTALKQRLTREENERLERVKNNSN